jgi:DNA polymerase V
LDCFESARDEGLGDTLDLINNRFGSAAVGIGHAGIRGKGRPDHQATGPWDMHREKLSKRITTRWDEKLVVYAN